VKTHSNRNISTHTVSLTHTFSEIILSKVYRHSTVRSGTAANRKTQLKSNRNTMHLYVNTISGKWSKASE